MMKKIFNLMVLFCFAVATFGQDTNKLCKKGDSYYYKEKYDKALECYMKASNLGNGYASFRIGTCYKYGKGVGKSSKKELIWYALSADQGYEYGAGNMVVAYVNEIADVDSQKIAKYIHMLELKPSNWYDLLGFCYLNGRGVATNYKKSLEYYKKAANDLYANGSKMVVGDFYFYGTGVEVDYVEALKWYELASKDWMHCKDFQAYRYSKMMIGNCYYKGLGVNLDYSKAVSYYEEANEYGYGPLSEYNYYIKKDYKEALQLAFNAIKHDYILTNIPSYMVISNCYYHGRGVQSDLNQAFKYVKLGAEKGNVDCMKKLAAFYKSGIGCSKDLTLAKLWMGKAANLCDHEALIAADRVLKINIKE